MIRSIVIASLVLATTVARADTAEDGPREGFDFHRVENALAVSDPVPAVQAQQAAAQGQAAEARRDLDQRAQNAASAKSGLATAGRAISMLRSYQELVAAYRALNAADHAFDPSHPGDGAPGLPVSCASSACAKCYRDAQLDLNRSVFTLNKLLHIYQRTKSFSDKAIAFGNSASGVHAVSGLAWQDAKRGIDASVADLKKAFDNKKPELMRALKAALDRIGACETQYYANPDWYNRFGFFYYQFMDARIVHD